MDSRPQTCGYDVAVLFWSYNNNTACYGDSMKVENLISLDQHALEHECEKLDIKAEQRMAEEGFSGDLIEWPEC